MPNKLNKQMWDIFPVKGKHILVFVVQNFPVNLVKTQIPKGDFVRFILHLLSLFGDNRGFVLFGAMTSVVALFYFAGENYG